MIAYKKFHEFTDWNLDRILFSKELFSKYPMVCLGEIISPRKERTRALDVPKDRRVVSKIRFADGVVFFKDRIIKNDMNKSCLNDLLVSNINFEKGAFAINTWGDIYASTDYTSYIIDTTKVIPEYLRVVLRTSTFLDYVATVKPKGMKTRARYEFIKTFSIPIPLLSEQQKLLDEYYATLNKANILIASAENINSEIDAYLYDYFNMDSSENRALGTSLLKTFKLSKSIRWDVDYALNDKSLDYLNGCNCPVVPASKFILSTQYGLSEKASKNIVGVPMIRMGNVKDSKIDLADLKYLPKTDALKGRYLDKGDLLFNRTNSKELVGKTAIFDLDGEYVFASYLIRVKIDSRIADINYINYMFSSRIIRRQIDIVSRQVLGQVNMNVDELSNLQFPLPSLPEQKKIISEIDKIRTRKKSAISDADTLITKGRKNFENTIFA